MAGLLQPDSGQVIKKDLSKGLFSYNTERLPAWVTVEEHLKSVLPKGNDKLLEYLITNFGVMPIMEHKFPKLSMGQKNRVNLIRYLVQDFDLLIADEVMANVDEPSRKKILSIIKKTFPDRTFIYISHNAHEVVLFSKAIFVFPQAGQTAISGLTVVDGLDLDTATGREDENLQGKVLDILRASSRST